MQLLNRRRGMGKGEEPCPYQLVEYLQSTKASGEAYITTDYTPMGQDVIIFIDFALEGYSTGEIGTTIIGTRGYQIQRYSNTSNKIVLYNGTTNYPITAQFSFVDAQRYHVEMNGKERTWKINETKNIFTDFEPNITSGRFSIGRATHYPLIKIYSLKVKQNNLKILDLIPVRIGDEGFMYNKINGKLYGNSGSGKFILGPDIN